MRPLNSKFISVLDKIVYELSLRPLFMPAIGSFLYFYLFIYFESLIVTIVVLFLLFTAYKHKSFVRIKFSILITIIIIIPLSLLCFYRFTKYPVTNEFDTSLVGTVASKKEKLDNSAEIIIKTNDNGYILWNTTYDVSHEFVSGDTIMISGSIMIPSTSKNPGEFDYRKYLRNSGIGASVYPDTIQQVKKAKLHDIRSRMNIFLNDMKHNIIQLFDDKADYASALFLGDTSLLSEEGISMFRRVNCSHLLAVSGTHFTAFLSILPFLFDSLGSKSVINKIAYFLSCFAIGAFTGWSPSVMRASFVSVASYLSKDKISGLSAASLLMIVINPFIVNSLGFQMTFLCTLSIHLFARGLEECINRYLRIGDLSLMLAVVISSQIALLPFSGGATNGFSFFLLPLQIITTSIVQLCCTLFVPSVIFGLVFSKDFCLIIRLLIVVLEKIISFSADSIPLSSSKYSYFVMFFVFFTVVMTLKKSIFKLILKTVSLFLIASSLSSMLFDYYVSPDVKLIFIDVGQGDSCLIINDEFSVLIDGGTYEAGKYHVAPVLDYYGVNKIDVAIMSHWDEDHAGGIAYLYKEGRINQLVTSCVKNNYHIKEFYDKYFSDISLSLDEFLADNIQLINKGSSYYLSNSIKLWCIYPIEAYDGDNDDSVVMLLESESFKCLFTGDISSNVERLLMNEDYICDCDILKIAHHGSKYSSCIDFLQSVNPSCSIVSVGEFNRYGHPSERVINDLCKIETDLYLTYETGAIFIDIYDDKYRISTFCR